MTAIARDESHHRRPALRAAAALAVLLALCAAVVVAGASADPASAAKAKTLGKTKGGARSECPSPKTDRCQAVGRLTGFQVRATGGKNPFVAPRSGRLVAWSVDLTGRPKPSQRRFFGKLYGHKPYGTAPAARIAVLKKKGKKYRLKSQSAPIDLSDSIGEKPIFTLATPLRIAKGDILALTMPTWTSAFAVGVSARENVWRASRSGKACEVGTDGQARENLKKSKPQEKVGSTRAYGCVYRGAQLLYWGYYVPS